MAWNELQPWADLPFLFDRASPARVIVVANHSDSSEWIEQARLGGPMNSDQGQLPDGVDPVALPDKTVSRREFLKLAGIAGAVVGVGGGLGGVLAACGGTSTTTTAATSATTTGATTATTAAPASSTTAAAVQTTTSAAAAVEAGREIKLGVVSPLT
jgi:hypothetical protein